MYSVIILLPLQQLSCAFTTLFPQHSAKLAKIPRRTKAGCITLRSCKEMYNLRQMSHAIILQHGSFGATSAIILHY